MKKLNWLFAISVVLVLIACLAVSIFLPKEINEYENRYMEQYATFGASSFFSGEFQDQAELALGDQLPLAVTIKKMYNSSVSFVSTKILNKVLDVLYANNPSKDVTEDDTGLEKEDPIYADLDRGIYRGVRRDVKNDPSSMYISFSSGMRLYKNHLMYGFTQLDWVKNELDLWLNSANTLISEYPNIKFYSYYIEKENEVDFVAGERSGLFDYLYGKIDLAPEDKRGFFIDNFEDYDSWFYRTDHHWSAYGSYRGYTQVLDMILPDEIPLESNACIELGSLSGSKAKEQETQNYTETISVLDMDFSPVEVYINGSSAKSYGEQERYIREVKDGTLEATKFTYGSVYGWDNGETILSNGAKDTGNILILGESFDNALLLPLAQHFSKIYSIDLRNYKTQVGKDFDFDSYVKEHNIERVLFIGNVDYFILEAFRLR